MRASALFEGRLRHRRHEPRERAFSYAVQLLYLDLDELPSVFDGRLLWSVERPNLCSVRRADYLGDPAVPLKQAVLERVEQELGFRPAGPVRMLTQVRQLGYVFNPVTFYYCFEPEGQLAALVAEITNTPWNERHAYVLDARGRGRRARCFRFEKRFHVSPFFGMDHVYGWRFAVPGARLAVHMENVRAGRRVFDATLALRRRELTARNLARALARHPLMPQRVTLAIYWQALLLWLRRTPFFPHPARAAAETAAGPRAS
jgi:hypothetical protein